MFCHVLHADGVYPYARSGMAPAAGSLSRARFAGARAGAKGRIAAAGRPREMSCFVMRGRFRRAAGAVLLSGCSGGRLRSCVPPSRQRAGRVVPVSRVIARAWARGRGRAYRGGAARAPDCARETAHAPRPSVPAGVFFAAPAVAFCRKAERRPRKPPLSTFILHHTAECQAHSGTKNETIGYFSRNAGGTEARTGALRPGPRPVTLSPQSCPSPSCPDLFRASTFAASAAWPHGCPEQVRA